MKEFMKYKEFTGSIQFDATDNIFHGKLEAIDDLVTFEGQSFGELEKAFRDAVEDYLVLCRVAGKEPDRSIT